jgi:acetyl-CoA carboxylase biotin carboxylase subunit
MFKRILIANRGEIAVRVIRACRSLGITSIAVYSTADKESLHTQLADECVCIGPAEAGASYLNIPSIIAAAEITGADAIHPGYGFLAESPKFANICRDCKIRFIGPSPSAIMLSGNKSACREIVSKAGVPVVPGSEGLVTGSEQALKLARDIGYPVLVKAAAGGGGKGMRIARDSISLRTAVATATHEAQQAFGDSGVYLEKFVENARHVEFQIMADEHGRAVSLGERECSIQRRHQKLIEEAPCIALTPEKRAEMAEASLAAVRAMGYTNAGTAEFLYGNDGSFYFIEFNARIQVEHPVTEAITGTDLVVEQIRIAAGEHLSVGEVELRGHAIEARVYAENPDLNFRPSPGTIKHCRLPGGPGIRVDTHIYSGYPVPRYYDAMLAKVIAWGQDRHQAIERLAVALDEFEAIGVDHTAAFSARIIRGDRFRSGDIGPDLIEEFLPRAS